MSVATDHFEDTTARDFFWEMCGEKIGGGMSREVYSCVLDPTVVIKFESRKGSFQNILEWEAWQEVKETEFAKWFAPCVSISGTGIVLIQKRTKPILNPKKLPEKMPTFLGDFKQTNFGMYKGHICAHDYGRTRLMTAGLTKHLRPVNWWHDLDT